MVKRIFRVQSNNKKFVTIVNLFASTLSNCDIMLPHLQTPLPRNTRQFIQLHPHDLLTRSIYLPIKSRVLLSRLNWQLRDYAIAFVLKHPLERLDTWPCNVIQDSWVKRGERRTTSNNVDPSACSRPISFMNSRGKSREVSEKEGASSMERREKERRKGKKGKKESRFYPICWTVALLCYLYLITNKPYARNYMSHIFRCQRENASFLRSTRISKIKSCVKLKGSRIPLFVQGSTPRVCERCRLNCLDRRFDRRDLMYSTSYDVVKIT